MMAPPQETVQLRDQDLKQLWNQKGVWLLVWSFSETL